MKFLSVIVALLILVSGSVCFGADIRNANWGMTVDDVKAVEASGTIFYESEDDLFYNVTLANLECILVYGFSSKGLKSVHYMLNEEHQFKNKYYDDYKKLVALLKKKYGKPKESEGVWLNTLYKDDPSELGLALSLGHYKEYDKWSSNGVDITALIHGDNFEVKLVIGYENKAFENVAEKEQKELQDF